MRKRAHKPKVTNQNRQNEALVKPSVKTMLQKQDDPKKQKIVVVGVGGKEIMVDHDSDIKYFFDANKDGVIGHQDTRVAYRGVQKGHVRSFTQDGKRYTARFKKDGAFVGYWTGKSGAKGHAKWGETEIPEGAGYFHVRKDGSYEHQWFVGVTDSMHVDGSGKKWIQATKSFKTYQMMKGFKPEKKKLSPEEFDKLLEERLQNPKIRAMMVGLSTAANKEYGPHGLSPNISDAQKQKDFENSGIKTVSILMMEFFTGTGETERTFTSKHDITEYVKWSVQTYFALEYLEQQWKSHNVDYGQKVPYTSQTSPGQTDIGKSIWAHGNQFIYNRPSFYLGGMAYIMTIHKNRIDFIVTNEYTISSGVMKDGGKSNLERVEGHTSPLGNTTQTFKFSHSMPDGPPKR